MVKTRAFTAGGLIPGQEIMIPVKPSEVQPKELKLGSGASLVTGVSRGQGAGGLGLVKGQAKQLPSEGRGFRD